MEIPLVGAESVIAVVQVIVSIFCLTYAYDVLVLHRRFKALGQVLVKYIKWFILGIFITIGSVAVAGFGQALIYVNISQTIGIFFLGIFFRKCMHEFFTQPMHMSK